MVYMFLAFAGVVAYFLGSINFARIFQWNFNKKDITKVGSHNPGTMNVLRTRGFGEAMLTLVFEALKVGGPALACWFAFGSNPEYAAFAELAYFVSAACGIFGHCFPIYYGFKGGKGVACTFGMFVFNPHFWWVSLIGFAICFVLFMFIEYGFIISFIFIFGMAIYGTCFFSLYLANPANIAVIVILWVNALLVVFLHRGNIRRFLAGQENKVNFREKVFGKLKKNKSVQNEQTENQKVAEDVAPAESKIEKKFVDKNVVEEKNPKVKNLTAKENKNSKNTQKSGKNVKKNDDNKKKP